MSAPEWGDVPYDHRTPEQIVHDYAVVRGDLSEQYARDQLAAQWRRHVAAAWDEGYEAGSEDAYWGPHRPPLPNPFRSTGDTP